MTPELSVAAETAIRTLKSQIPRFAVETPDLIQALPVVTTPIAAEIRCSRTMGLISV